MSWKKHFTTYETKLGQQSPVGSSYGEASNSKYSSWLPEVYAGQPNRIERYYQYATVCGHVYAPAQVALAYRPLPHS